ncbi:MAG: flagellar hook capping FlgD N-terminal domain-containing protein [Planctomycetota bacterium]
MDITNVGNASGSFQSLTGSSSEVGSQDFLRLLITQLQNQSPLEPQNNEEFVSQLAQFSSLESTQALNSRMDLLAQMQQESLTLQQLAQGSALIGKKIDYVDPKTGEDASGQVDSVSVEQGLVQLRVDGKDIPLGYLERVHGQDE